VERTRLNRHLHCRTSLFCRPDISPVMSNVPSSGDPDIIMFVRNIAENTMTRLFAPGLPTSRERKQGDTLLNGIELKTLLIPDYRCD